MALAEVLSLLAPPLCWGCREPVEGQMPMCGGCRRRLRWLGGDPVAVAGLRLWAPLAYEGPARELVRALKFRGALALAATMAAQIVASAPPALLGAATLVPVPLHPVRRRQRGYNQAELLASAVAERTGLPLAGCLERGGRPGARQVGRGRVERLTGVGGAITVAGGREVPRRALIVDDVVTTGATLGACAEALRGAGAQGVDAIAYARTPGR